jgi:hypothetical protein
MEAVDPTTEARCWMGHQADTHGPGSLIPSASGADGGMVSRWAVAHLEDVIRGDARSSCLRASEHLVAFRRLKALRGWGPPEAGRGLIRLLAVAGRPIRVHTHSHPPGRVDPRVFIAANAVGSFPQCYQGMAHAFVRAPPMLPGGRLRLLASQRSEPTTPVPRACDANLSWHKAHPEPAPSRPGSPTGSAPQPPPIPRAARPCLIRPAIAATDAIR